MTTEMNRWQWWRTNVFPLAFALTLAIGVIVFRGTLVNWFTGWHRDEPAATADEKAPDPPAATGSALRHEFSTPAETELERAMQAYESIRSQLAADTTDGVANSAHILAASLRAASEADPTAPDQARDDLSGGAKVADELAAAGDLAGARVQFGQLSDHMLALTILDPRLGDGLRVYECPMTKGPNKWLQPGDDMANPFKGTAMLTCGNEVDTAALAAAEAKPATSDVPAGETIDHYTCPMDTWVHQKGPGKCPACGMTLVPVTVEEMRTGTMRIDHRRRQLIGVKTALAEKRDLDLHVHAIGQVVYDESKISDVTLKYDGFIDHLIASETGKPVRKGQMLFRVYSPELYTAQKEYLLAVNQRAAAQTDAGRERATTLVDAARRRLQLLDVTSKQIARLEKTGKAEEYIPVLSPASGFVVEKNVVEGAAVKRGERLFRVAALDHVWVEAEVYEEDIPHVHVGQEATITLSHQEDKRYTGKVAYVLPYLDGAARTARVRIELPNRNLELKPEMYADVDLMAPLGERLVVPEPAIIYSGPRRIVFIDLGNDRLRPVPVKTGAKSNDWVEITDGIKEGDRVVISGNFLLSAESRLKSATGLW